MNRSTSLLLNAAHTLDHLVLLIFASAVSVIAIEFGFTNWQDLMPYTAGAFLMFGLGSIPSGRLGDLWGRRKMMVLYFFGLAASCGLVALTQNAWQIAAALTLMGLFASIYHPVGIPMLLRHAVKPGLVIGWNNLAGNMGIALAALFTGLAVKYFGWRSAFWLAALLSIGLGLMFLKVCPTESEPAGKRKASGASLPRDLVIRALVVMTTAATSGSILFNFTTNSNAELLKVKFDQVVTDPAVLGFLLAGVYAVAAFSQVAAGWLLDRVAIKKLFMTIVAFQIAFLLAASQTTGWLYLVFSLGFMAAIFGAIPFVDAVIVRYVDDSMRSRATGMRIAITFGVSSLAVYLIGPTVKSFGFDTMLLVMAALACFTIAAMSRLPSDTATAQTR
ncbi:MAG: MFS transporter [Burkholderiaceae bacterium]